MLLGLVLIPLLAAGGAFLLRSNSRRLGLLIGTALLHLALVVFSWRVDPHPLLGGWLALDAIGLIFLTLVSVVFICASLYAVEYLRREARRSNRTFVGCLLGFLAAMSLVTMSQHLGLLWVAVEGTTLASAPLIYFHHSQRSLEATWKYLLLCSVGIALALLGTFFVAMAGSGHGGGDQPSLVVSELISAAGQLHLPWLKGGFLFFLVGYGTKMGLAPFHTWLPDAHSEAPSPASALLSGALLNCAFLGILRLFQVCVAAGLGAFVQELLVVFGVFSLVVAAVFIVGQSDYKRLLAYSSIEHMGILSLGVGLGGAGAYGAMLHAVNHSLTKALLFFVAGNILLAHGTKLAADVRGLLRRLPVSGALLLGGFFAITGAPPFGLFLSEFTILNAAVSQGRMVVAALYLILLAVVFLGMGAIILPMAQGQPADMATGSPHAGRESGLLVGVPLALLIAVLVLGLYVPPSVNAALSHAAQLVGGVP
ncbi:MAG: hydrogenase [Candidatus Omnitrophica bacterium]|nr:hydrogenase [Candidatus Omnitrophota bacterium]